MEGRIISLNNLDITKNTYILYWMDTNQRTKFNHSLEYSIREANRLNIELIVVFNLCDNSPHSTLRHYQFMLEGIEDVKIGLEDRGIPFLLIHGDIEENISRVALGASLVVCDKGYLKGERTIRSNLVNLLNVPFIQVESNLVVPIEITSTKEEYSARTIRTKINRNVSYYSNSFEYKEYKLKVKSKFNFLCKELEDIILELDISKLLDSVATNREVKPSKFFIGGEVEAQNRLEEFISNNLLHYEKSSNDPSKPHISKLSPYIHFGQISPLDIYQRLKIIDHIPLSNSIESFLEELVVRRELAFNFVYYNEDYDSFDKMTYGWAYKTMEEHLSDERLYLYSIKELEEASTHDKYWNACMLEMKLTGFMHGYMRMYWCKKILEWSKSYKEAYKNSIYLNNKYFLDGSDPNSYTGIAWCFGKHDRAWQERHIFGKLRCMKDTGLKRKFDIDLYVENIEEIRKNT